MPPSKQYRWLRHLTLDRNSLIFYMLSVLYVMRLNAYCNETAPLSGPMHELMLLRACYLLCSDSPSFFLSRGSWSVRGLHNRARRSVRATMHKRPEYFLVASCCKVCSIFICLLDSSMQFLSNITGKTSKRFFRIFASQSRVMPSLQQTTLSLDSSIDIVRYFIAVALHSKENQVVEVHISHAISRN